MNIAVFSPHPHKGRLIQQYLRAFTCDIFSAKEDFIHADQYSLGIIDLVFAHEEWQAIAELLSAHHLPVLFIASSKQIDVITLARKTPRSDYIINPLQRLDINTRVTVLLETFIDHYAQKRTLTLEEFSFDVQNNTVSVNNTSTLLTQKEFAVAQLLLSHLNHPLSRVYIQDIVWGKDSTISGRTIDTHVSRVRNKLNLIPANGYLLTSIYSFGYQLEKTDIKQ